jgi:hypothetical protein
MPAARTVAVVVPPVWTHVFLYAARLVRHALEDLGHDAAVVEYDGTLAHRTAVVLGWDFFEQPLPAECRYVLYQLEPLCLPHWQGRLAARRTLFERAAAVWDYSEANLPYLEGLPARVVPLGWHEALREVTLAERFQEYDVLFAGFLSPRRRTLLEALSQRCSVSMQPRWGGDLRAALANAKILLNVHQYDLRMPLEQPRVGYALNQGAFVLTEDSEDRPYGRVASAPYERLAEAALHYLTHPNERRAEQAAMAAEFAGHGMARSLEGAVHDWLGDVGAEPPRRRHRRGTTAAPPAAPFAVNGRTVS